MSTWRPQRQALHRSREATLTHLINVIDRTAPMTVNELSEEVEFSEEYVAELVQELKTEGLVTKAYVVNDQEVYRSAEDITPFGGAEDSGDAVPAPGSELWNLLRRLDEVTSEQFAAVRSQYLDEAPDTTAVDLEPLVNQRYVAVVDALKSYTITVDWPGNRAAADLAVVARNLERVGNRLAFISEVLNSRDTRPTGLAADRIADLLETGARLRELFSQIVFEQELDRLGALDTEAQEFHRDLNELFELASSYEPATYSDFVTIGRSLEWIVKSWIEAAEIVVSVHTGLPTALGEP